MPELPEVEVTRQSFADRIAGAKVLAMHIHDDCVMDAEKNYVDTVKLGLVGRMHGRGWYARTTDRFDMPRMTPEEWAEKKARAAG